MTTPEQLKEEWMNETDTTGDVYDVTAIKKFIADWWLNKIQSLLGEIERKVEKINVSGGGSGRRLKVQILSIIQEYKGKKI